MNSELVVIGGGPAGLAAAVAAREAGVEDVLVLERDNRPGGILQQCIHGGFGLHKFGEELTGPEYAWRYEQRVRELGIPVMTGTMTTGLTRERRVTAVNPERGVFTVDAGAVILAMGCRERPRGALAIPGDRPAGILTAGAAQKLVNRMGMLPGREVVILGSGDIGLIMARRMTLEGAQVKAVCEILPYSGGLARNIQQCLHDFGIPLLLRHTVTDIRGRERLTGVTIAEVDEQRRPLPGTGREIACDTLLLSVGLIPENELSLGAGLALSPATGGPEADQDRQTAIPGVFACGNVLHVHDLVDYVSDEAAIAGRGAAAFLRGETPHGGGVRIEPGAGVRYTVPQAVTAKDKFTVYFRTDTVYNNVSIVVRDGDRVIRSRKRKKLAPGEMETLTLDGAALTGPAVTVSIEEQEAGA